MSETILLGLNIFFGVLVVFGMFWGLIRGLKKTFSRFIFLLITAIILLFVCVPLVTSILKINITATVVNNNVSTQETMTILEFITYFIKDQLGAEFVSKYSEVVEIIVSVAIALINAFVYVILFWVLKLLLLPINWLINKIIFSITKKFSKKDIPDDVAELSKKELKALGRTNKPKKYRLLGALMGVLVGILTTFCTMIPIYGVMDIVAKHNKTTLNNFSDEPMSLEILTDGLSTDIVKAYELSIIGRLSKGVGLNKLGLNSFDELTTMPVDDTEFTLRDDVNSLVETAVETDNLIGLYKTATADGIENITQENLTALIDSTKVLITKCENTGFVNALSKYILPLAYDIMIENNVQIVENEQVNQLIIETIAILAEESGIDIFAELKGLVDVADYLNDQGLLIRIVTNNYDNILPVIKGLDNNFANKLTTKLFALEIIDKTFPNIINIGFTVFDNATDFGYTENNATTDELQSALSDILANIISTAKTLSEDKPFVTPESFVEIGKTLDTLKLSKLYNTSTYNNLITFALDQVKGSMISTLPETFKDVVETQIMSNIDKLALVPANIEEIKSWEDEMTIFYDAYQILFGLDINLLSEEETDNTSIADLFVRDVIESTMVNLGEALDKLEESTILGTNTTYTVDGESYTTSTLLRVVSCAFDEMKSSSGTDTSTTDSTSEIFDIAKTNLIKTNHVYTENGTFWATEMTTLSSTIAYIMDISAEEEFEITPKLGTELDNVAHNSIIFGGDATLKIVDILISSFEEDSSEEESSFNTLISEISTNLKSEELKLALASNQDFWSNEINCIISLLDISESLDSVTDIDSATIIAEDLDTLYSSRIIPYMSLNEMIADVITSLKSDTAEEGSVDAEINTLLDDIATDISSKAIFDSFDKTNFWQNEFKHMSDLNSISFDNTDNALVNSLDSLGSTLDDITANSQLITELRIRKILASAINSASSSISGSFSGEIGTAISNALVDISKNIYNSTTTTQIEIDSFESELSHLKTLATVEIDPNCFVYTTGTSDISKIEASLSDLGEQLDSISFNISTTNNKTSYNEANNSKIITRPTINNIVASAFTNSKISGTNLSTIETAFNTLIDDIKASITSISSSNKVITWQRELAYVSTLIQLNSNETINIDNVTDAITKNLDKISFNSKDNAFADVDYEDDTLNIVGTYAVTYTESTDTKYYNSVVITRTMLKTMMNSIVSTLKVTGDPSTLSSEDKIYNELIDNLTTKVNDSDTFCLDKSMYNNYTEAFTDLKSVDTEINNLSDSLIGVNLDTLQKTTMTNIDATLSSFQNDKTITGITTTKHITVMILDIFMDELEAKLTTIGRETSASETHAYLTSLINYYSNDTRTTAETYSSAEVSNIESTTLFDNPMARLYHFINAEFISILP